MTCKIQVFSAEVRNWKLDTKKRSKLKEVWEK